MSKWKNLVYLLIFGGFLFVLKFLLIDRSFGSLPNDASIWFTSGLLLIILGVFVTEKYFTRSLDVIVNVITLTVVLLTLDKPNDFYLWGALFTYNLIVGFIAMLSFVLFNEEKDQNLLSQKISGFGNTISRFLGSSRMLFSIIFILSIFNYFVFSLQNNQNITEGQVHIILLIIFWGMVILIEPIDRKFIKPIIDRIKNKNRPNIIGRVVKRMSPSIIVAEELKSVALEPGGIVLLDDSSQSNISDPNIFMYLYSQVTENKKYSFFFSLNENQKDITEKVYIHELSLESKKVFELSLNRSEIYKNKDNLIGFVHTGSDIDILKIKMIEGVDEKKQIKEGDLVSVDFYKSTTKYQIINVETSSENVSGDSKQGTKIITAQQIGSWKDQDKKFEDTAWVPEVNLPVFLETSQEEIKVPKGSNYKVGVVPRSQYPIYLNLADSVSHHIAVIGKTGTGKSKMSSSILEKMVSSGYKVVVFEVDRRHKESLSKYLDSRLIEEQDSDKFDLSKSTKSVVCINWKITEQDKEGGTLNLSDIAVEIIQKVIVYQQKNEKEKICIAMEEAYDFIPENNFGQQQYGQPKVSRISQMVLKCRKHNIGFLIITQRTALVTKTILYQCHTIIALQSFDETSKTFMSAYINQKYLDSMSILPRFRAIVVGKGSSCHKPVIVDFFDKTI